MKKILITIDVNDWDYVTNQISCIDALVPTVVELISKFKWSHTIDVREVSRENIVNNCLTQEEQVKLRKILDIKDYDTIYWRLFDSWCSFHDEPHTLISLEVVTSEQFISFRNY